jgi:hypothetical protein
MFIFMFIIYYFYFYVYLKSLFIHVGTFTYMNTVKYLGLDKKITEMSMCRFPETPIRTNSFGTNVMTPFTPKITDKYEKYV